MTTSTRTGSCWFSRIATSHGPLAAALLLLVGLVGPAAGEGGYRLGPGDEVGVEVWREPDLSGTHVLDEDGELQHVLVGEVPAANLTPEELALALQERLERDYLRDARVVVTLKQSARRKAWILGSAAKPGSYPLEDGARLLDLVFAAGGLAESADGSATLYRMGEPAPGEDLVSPVQREPLAEYTVDLSALLTGDLSANHPIEAGDVLVVTGAPGAVGAPATQARIRVVGEVQEPGTYPLTEAPTALDAVLAAGGFTEYASGTRARLVRGEGEERTDERLRLSDIVRGRKGADNVSLEDGDLIVVPESFF